MKSKDQRIFLEALDELEREKGIKKDELLEAVETALLAAYKKNYGDKENAEIEEPYPPQRQVVVELLNAVVLVVEQQRISSGFLGIIHGWKG